MQEYTKAEIDECKQAILHHKEVESKPIRPNFQLLSKWQNDPLFKVFQSFSGNRHLETTMYDLIDYQREERERWNEPTPEEAVMMRNEEIEQAVEYFLYAIAQGWEKLTDEEEQMIHTYKDDPYFEELIQEAGTPEIK